MQLIKRYIMAGMGLIFIFLISLPAHTLAATYVYIPNYDNGTVTRFDTQSGTSVASVKLSDGPYGVAAAPDGSLVLVTATDGNRIARITNADFNENAVPRVLDVGDEPRGVAIESSGLYAYVANYADNTVTKIDLRSFTVAGNPIDVGNGPWGVAAFYDEVESITRVYVSNHADDSITVISDDNLDISTHTIENVGQGPIGVALTPDGRFLYVANFNNGNTGTVAIVRTSDNTVVNSVRVEQGPWAVAVGSDGAFVYVSNSESDNLTVIRTSDQAVERYVVGNQPLGVAALKNGESAFVINHLDDSISRLDRSNQVVSIFEDGDIHGAFALGDFIGAAPPAKPSGLKATAVSYSRIELSWTGNEPASDIVGIKIQRRASGDAEFVQIAKLGAAQTVYKDSGLSDETTYEYRIQAFNEEADSDFSLVAEATTQEGDFSWCFIGALLLR